MNRLSIGFDRTLQIHWLDLAASQVLDGASEIGARERLRAELQSEVSGQEGLEKTLLVLLRIWYPSTIVKCRLRDEAAELVRRVEPGERLALYWGLTSISYQFFRDAAAIIGRLSRLQPVVSASQMQRRLVEDYGDRVVVERARQHVMRTMVLWGVVKAVSRRGEYEVAEPIEIKNLAVQRWLLEATVRAASVDTVPLEGATLSPENFPFRLTDEAALIARDPRFHITAQGDRRLIVSLAS